MRRRGGHLDAFGLSTARSLRARRGGRRSGGGGGGGRRSGGGGGSGGRRSGGSGGGGRSGGSGGRSGGSGGRSGGSGGSGSRSGGGSGGGSHSESGGGHGGDGVEIGISEDGVEVGYEGASVGVERTEDGGVALEVGRSVELGEFEHEIPIAAVPGLNITFGLGLSAGVSERASFGGTDPELTVSGTLSGEARVGLSYGIPDVASVYMQAGPDIEATARLTFDREGLKEAVVDVELSAAAEVGVRATGLFDLSVELGRLDIGSFNGSGWTRERGWRWGTFAMSDQMQDAVQWVRRAIDAATSRAARVGRRVASGFSAAWDWVTGG